MFIISNIPQPLQVTSSDSSLLTDLIIAIVGAVIGGIVSFLIAWYQVKKAKEDIESQRKMDNRRYREERNNQLIQEKKEKEEFENRLIKRISMEEKANQDFYINKLRIEQYSIFLSKCDELYEMSRAMQIVHVKLFRKDNTNEEKRNIKVEIASYHLMYSRLQSEIDNINVSMDFDISVEELKKTNEHFLKKFGTENASDALMTEQKKVSEAIIKVKNEAMISLSGIIKKISCKSP